MVSVDDLGNAADKFERNASNAGQDFASGVEQVSDQQQQEATLDATDAWAQGVQEAINDGTFASGVNNPTQSWQEQTLEVGQQRFTRGVQDAGDAWQSGFQPVANALENLSLEPRGPAGSAANRERMNSVFDELSNLDV